MRWKVEIISKPVLLYLSTLEYIFDPRQLNFPKQAATFTGKRNFIKIHHFTEKFSYIPYFGTLSHFLYAFALVVWIDGAFILACIRTETYCITMER